VYWKRKIQTAVGLRTGTPIYLGAFPHGKGPGLKCYQLTWIWIVCTWKASM